MYLKQLDIHGFKTFAEKTRIVFTPGVTCVIGPNGSGKSNIADAILWVLGEHNVRSLRGATAQDVIFAGNERRRPLGMAEVSLTLDNSARILPLDFSEITVTRRLYRSGESECRINRVACRLRDIYELFLDTGIGRDAYSMVNQGEIDQILSVRAEDRRALFEEAAGIKKYRVRKREAERKLEATAHNLLRVNDIVAEIEGQLGPLQRQAAAARRFLELGGRLQVLESAWYGSRLRRIGIERERLAALAAELGGERARLDAALEEAQAAEGRAREELTALETAAEAARRWETAAMERIAAAGAERVRAEERGAEVRRRLAVLERELADLAARIGEQVTRQAQVERDEAALRREVDTLRRELAGAQEQARQAGREHDAASAALEHRRQASLARARREAEAEARVQSLEARLRTLGEASGRARAAVEDAAAESDRLLAEVEGFTLAATAGAEQAAGLEKELEASRAGARTAEAGTAAARAAAETSARLLQGHQARLQALAELAERGEGAAAGARKLLAAARRGQVPGSWTPLLEALAVPAGREKAVAAALGVYADALLCDSQASARAALAWARDQQAAVLALPGTPPETAPLPGSLAGEVTAEEPAASWARALLGGVLPADSLEAAAAERERLLSAGERLPELWVTPEGAWLAASGAAAGGAPGAEGQAAAVLTRRRELERLRAGLPELEEQHRDARAELGAAEASLRQTQASLRELQGRADAVRLEAQARRREAERRQGDAARARQRDERLRDEAGRGEREQAACAAELETARAARERLRGEDQSAAPPEAGAPGAVVAAGEAVRALESARRAAEQQVTELRVRLAQQEQRLQGAGAAVRRGVDAGTFLDRQRSERLREQRTLQGESEQRALSFGTLAQQAAEAEAEARSAREELAALAARRAALTAEWSSSRAAANDLGARQRELLERAHRTDVELTALEAQRRQYGQQWLDAAASWCRPGCPLGGTRGAAPAAPPAETGTESEEPPLPTVEGLLAAWEAAAAERVLASCSDPEGEIARLRRQARSLGAVNPDALNQLGAAQERYEFLTSQRTDLEAAREQLEGAIAEIDAASRETFLRAFREIAAAFDVMFQKLFGGGRTELRLTDPDDVLQTGIDVIVQPPGKKQQNLLLLSGGERALTAAAMLFALLTVRPSPFCVLDEVDAPLDESNVGRFTETLREFSARTQFVVVTHNRGTMEGADTLYGVTMEERGVSRVLSCALDDPLVASIEAESAAPVAR